MDMKNLVTTEWLENNLGKENLVIFDVRYDMGDGDYGKREYDNGHIPNGIFVSLEDVLTGEVQAHGGRHPLPDIKKFIEAMNTFGVDDESIVVAYDDGDLSTAGRLWWMLRYIGFNQIYVLFGGYREWKDNKHPVSREEAKIREAKDLTFNLQANLIADIDEVKKTISDDTTVLIDSRNADRYRGETEPIDRIPGHIPSAINIPWTELFQNDEELDKEKIKEYYKTIADYDKQIVHCGSGITGTVNLIFMEEAGLTPVFYVGGYSDWLSYEDNEIDTEI